LGESYIGEPKRLQLLIEGESLFNDGTAIVLFNLMVTIAVTGYFSLSDSVINFVLVAGGGLVIGFVLGLLISLAISTIDNPLIETTLTSVLAFGSYIIAEQFHVTPSEWPPRPVYLFIIFGNMQHF